jgi:hypothetical protein
MKLNSFLMGIVFVLGGVWYVYFLGGFVNPNISDSAHAIGMMSAKGGSVRHPVELELNDALFGQFRILLTAKVLPPVSGDMRVELTGPEELDYAVSSRYPPGVPLFNRLDRWYTFEAPIFKGVTTGSDMVIGLRVKPPKEAGEYALTITDNNTGQVYLNMPVIFSKDGVAPTGEDCH